MMAAHAALKNITEDVPSPERSGEALSYGGLSYGGGYQPRRWSPASIGLAALVQAIPAVIALWVWQPALVQMAPEASLATFDVAPPVEPAPEPEKPVETPEISEAQSPPIKMAEPAPIEPMITIPSTVPKPTRATPAEAAPPASPPRPTPSAPSKTPASWQSLVLGRLNAVKAYPASARARRQQGVVMIRFTLDRQGKVLEIALAQSSGFALLDREAIALPKRASPLPPPPDDVKGERIELVVPVEFHF